MLIRTLQEFAAKPNCSELARDACYPAVLNLIRENQQVDLLHPDVVKAGWPLAVVIRALLDFSAENHFIKFNPWDPTIVIKRFPPSLIAYQYNPYRDARNRQATGQKAAPPAAGKRPDFLDWETFPDAEHYLIWTASSGRRFGILVQPVPIVPDHLIIASLDRETATGEHYPQQMTAGHLADMHELQGLLGALGYAMGFNDHDAGASVDHFHTQAVPLGFLPLVRACCAGDLAVGRSWSLDGGARLQLLEEGMTVGVPGGPQPYPARGFLLSAAEHSALSAPKQALLAVLQAADLRFNSISWPMPDGTHAEAFFPRGQEAILNRALKAGYVEMAGLLVLPNQDLFDSLADAEAGETGLGEAGLSAGAFSVVLETFMKKQERVG